MHAWPTDMFQYFIHAREGFLVLSGSFRALLERPVACCRFTYHWAIPLSFPKRVLVPDGAQFLTLRRPVLLC